MTTTLTDEFIDAHYPKMQHQSDECQACDDICRQAKAYNALPDADKVREIWLRHSYFSDGGQVMDFVCFQHAINEALRRDK